MAVKTPNRVKVNQLIILLSGLVLLTASILIFLFIIKNVYGRYNIDQILPSEKNLSINRSPRNIKVGILYSKYTEHLLDAGSTWLNDNITTWKKFFDNSKISYDVINDQTIEYGQHMKYNILILPGSKSLSDKEIAQIKKYLEKGGSVYSTGGPATFSDDAKWRGWDFFSEVFGMKFTKELTPDEHTKIHTLRGNLPLTAGIPTGFPLKIATWDRPISAEVLDPRTTQVSFWYNFRTENGLVGEEIDKSAGIAYGQYGKGRFVWMGFELNSVLGEQEDYIFFDRLFQNSINWLTYNPTVLIKDWPEPYKAAAIIMPVLSSNISNVKNIFGILKSEGIKATFAIDPGRYYENKTLIENISNYGEICSIVDIGYLESISDTLNTLYDYSTQLNRFNAARKTFSKMNRLQNTGVIPLYGLYDANSMHALISAGYDYIFTDSLTDRSVPKTVILGDKRLIAFTKTARDDYEVIRNYGLKDVDFQLYTYQEDVDRLLFEGGLYILKIHTEYQCQAQYVKVIKDLIKYMKEKEIWITSASEIKKWWLSKTPVEISSEIRSSRRIVVEISNPGDKPAKNVVVQVNLNKKIKNLEISSEIFGTPKPLTEYDNNRNILTFKLRNMEPNETFSYYIDFDNAGNY